MTSQFTNEQWVVAFLLLKWYNIFERAFCKMDSFYIEAGGTVEDNGNIIEIGGGS